MDLQLLKDVIHESIRKFEATSGFRVSNLGIKEHYWADGSVAAREVLVQVGTGMVKTGAVIDNPAAQPVIDSIKSVLPEETKPVKTFGKRKA